MQATWRDLRDVLERGRVDRRYERLILATSRHFLDALQKAPGKNVKACVLAHLAKNLTKLPIGEILARLAAVEPQLAHREPR